MANTIGFTLESTVHRLAFMPREDFYSISKDGNVAVVADGVTRDPCEKLPNTSTLLGKLRFAWGYPRPSPAAEAAKIVCRVVPEVLMDYKDKNQESIRTAFEEANKRIAAWNALYFPSPDYVTKNKAGSVAAVSVVQKDSIHYGYLSDCGVAILDCDGNLAFKTPDIGPVRYDAERIKSPELNGKDWRDPETRRIIRSKFINNPDSPYSYGVLNGDSAASKVFTSTGSYDRKGGETVLTYTDGVEPALFTGDLLISNSSNMIMNHSKKGLKSLCQKAVRSEGTLVCRFP